MLRINLLRGVSALTNNTGARPVPVNGSMTSSHQLLTPSSAQRINALWVRHMSKDAKGAKKPSTPEDIAWAAGRKDAIKEVKHKKEDIAVSPATRIFATADTTPQQEQEEQIEAWRRHWIASGEEERARFEEEKKNLRFPWRLPVAMTLIFCGAYYFGTTEVENLPKPVRAIRKFVNNYIIHPVLSSSNNAGEWVDRSLGPSHRALLPPAMPDGYGHKYTLVVDLDALIDTFPSKDGTVVITKRPGVDYLISNASKYYEIVLYSKEMGGTNQMVIYKIDPSNSFSHHLFRESGLKEHEKFIHDFTRLNRDPSKVVFIDSNPLNDLYEHANVVSVGKGNPKKPDTLLIDLVPILAKIAADNTPDVRDKLKDLQTPDLANRLRIMLGKPTLQTNAAPAPQQPGVFGFLKK